MQDEKTATGEDALQGADTSRAAMSPASTVHSPPIPEDEGDGTGEGEAGPASGTSGLSGLWIA